MVVPQTGQPELRRRAQRRAVARRVGAVNINVSVTVPRIRGGHGGGGDEGGGRAANVAEFSDEFTNCQALGHGGGGRGGHHGAQGRLELGVVIKRIVPIRVHNAIRRAPAGH